MHAENGIAIDVLIEQALARGQTDPRYHGIVRHELLEAEATHRAIKLAQVPDAPALHRPPVARRGAGGGGEGARRGLQRVRRDVPAVPLPVARRPRAAGLRGRQVRLLHPVARPRSTRPRCGGGCARTTCRWCPPTTARSASRGRRSWASATSPRSRTGMPERRAPDGPAVPRRASTGQISPARWVEIACATPARMFGLYPRKGAIAPGADADIVVYDPNATHVHRSAARRTT